ncbi:hypothetical protein AMECASPLE_005110 [Ameca splendens]|uniref:Uncharacterized protein n=1 Tax=Ameca splendens TaxID=208324 RepID=A0ABV0YAS7_9TELE
MIAEEITERKKKKKKRLARSTPFGFIDTFFSFHYCNVCKLLNGVFVQQFSDLYLSEVIGAQKDSTVEAQAPRERYFTAEAIAFTCTMSHTHAHNHTHRCRHVCLLLDVREQSRGGLCILEY